MPDPAPQDGPSPAERTADPPRRFRLSAREALDVRRSPTGDVGRLFTGAGLELVWVCKKDEAIDPDWFVSASVDLLLVLTGQLRVEFEDAALPPMTLAPLDLLILPAHVRCRAYRWPRTASEPTLFLAAYPEPSASGRTSHGSGADPTEQAV